MPRPNSPYLSRDVDRHGNLRWYVRAPGKPKVRLLQEYGTESFWQAYRDALAGKKARAPTIAQTVAGSFRALCQKYLSCPEYKALDVSTRQWRRRALELICHTKGNNPVEQMGTRHVRALRDELADSPGAANQRLKALKAMFSWAVEAEYVETNPARDVKLIRYKSDGHHTWTDAEVEKFEERHPLESVMD